MAPSTYDQIPYPTYPRPQTHPDRLAAVGKLFGMEPAPVAHCRVLEIGCGDGGNLIPMADGLPESNFVGIDAAKQPIAAGSRVAAGMDLTNLELHALDLRAIGHLGQFDYIVAHGVYSWVPLEVRDGLLTVCREHLAPEGIAFVSYNALPGGHLRQMLREMALYRTAGAKTIDERISQAREFLESLRQGPLLSPEWQALQEQEIAELLDRDDGSLYHDEFGEYNQRFYFHQFAAAAGQHGLQYLGEAEPHEMFDPTDALADFDGDILEREQLLDFRKARRFRQTLLCHAGRTLRRETSPSQMPDFLFSAPATWPEDDQIEGAHGIRITTGDEAAVRVAVALGDMYPLPIPFDDLVPYAGNPEILERVLYEMVTVGFANLHVYDFPCQDTVTARPTASRLARYQAATSAEVANACHINTPLDDTGRNLIQLLDGTRTHAEIAQALPIDPELLPPLLEWMAASALLVG
jgi:methyltransferase-like protein